MGNPSLNKERIDWIDRVKGLAILGIIIFHFFQNYPERLNIVTALDRNGARLGYAAVDIFFVMAGFNTSYVFASIVKGNIQQIAPNWKAWLQKRLLRLYPTYILAVAFTIIIYFIFSSKNLEGITASDYTLIFSGIADYKKFRLINPGFWFFLVILQFYLATPLIFRACQNQLNNFLFLGLGVGLLTKMACFKSQGTEFYLLLLQNNFLGSYFFQVCLGLYWGFIYYQHKSFRKADFIASLATFAVGIIVYALMIIFKIDIVYKLGVDILFTPFLFIGCYLLIENLSKQKWLSYGIWLISLMGIYSYQIYLIHQPLYFVLFQNITSHLQVNNYLKIIVVMIITALALICYVLLFTLVDQYLGKTINKFLTKQT